MHIQTTDLDPSPRILLGPGPSMVHPRVLRAMSSPLTGYLDPEWLSLLDEEQSLLRAVFRTNHHMTLSLSGTGSSGMEAGLCNMLEPGDRILVCCNGYFSERICDMAGRCGAEVRRIDKPWGEVFSVEEIEAALRSLGPVKMVALVQGETSTGALQPMEGIGEAVHRHGALLFLDCVTTLGGVPVCIDDWGVDIAYSCTQKCLGCAPGLAPATFSDRAMEALRGRKTRGTSWYFDLTLLEKYWGKERVYHHTPSATLHYGLREGLRIVLAEGLEARWRRHRENAAYLWAKLETLGMKPFVAPEHRLPSLTTVCIPEGVDDAAVRGRLLREYNLEIAAGFGPLQGKVWRVGLMGFSSRKELAALLVAALREILQR